MLLQAREKEEEDRGEKRRREEKSVAWRRNAALLQAREEEEEDRGKKRRREEKRREILIGADQDQNLFFSVVTLLCFQIRSFVSGFLSLALLRKPNREAKARRRWWWC